MSGYIGRCDRCGGETAPQPTPEEAHEVLKRHHEGEHRKPRKDEPRIPLRPNPRRRP